ncbi:hypothetical protein [Prevotella merdae]|uniref:hypothetical protein n=1 Tax=Prevotella merdae TaxID=2079531 RepID=UPI003568022C
MKKYLFFAASALALASCSSDDFLGENPGNVQNASNAINFSGDAGKITRATSNTATTDAEKLDKQFKVYGVKTTDGTMFHNVFVDYSVWYDENLTTSNTNKWEYVGNNQTIKYWDYSASEYRFVAGSPIDAFTYNKDLENISTIGTVIKSATVTGLAGHIEKNDVGGAGTVLETNPVYVAKPKIVTKDNYKEAVKFEFIRQQAMVRVGLYETIPGYFISEIKFYTADKTTKSNNVILTSATADYFVGGSDVKGTINYDWTKANPSYTYTYDDTGLTKSQNWYAGKLCTTKPLATKLTDEVADLYGTDKDMSDAGYFTVLPTPSETDPKPILIKCDYTLISDDISGEVINVTGATAAIPAAYSKWEANTRYTYLFKISQNTNGTTGKPGVNPEGLFPITFDAVVTEMTDKTQGTTTTVATPSITTYQEGSVTENGIEYKPGKAINVTVTNDKGEVQNLTAGGATVGSVAVYKFTDAINEAEIQVKGLTGATNVTGTVDGNVFTFTPDAAGYYAIQYLTKEATTTEPATPAAYTYKVVEVK